MKKTMSLFLSIIVMHMLLVDCTKEKGTVNYSTVDTEKAQLKSAFSLSQAYNDTLILVYDTAKIRLGNMYCLKYDTLYHKNDSLFNKHYMMFGNEMYRNGMMMSNYAPSGSMMQGGMLNNGKMDKNRMMNDTSLVGGYYRNMHLLHGKHATYHNSIYN